MTQSTADKVLNAIQALGLKHWYQDGDEWRGSSPIRSGSDGDNFSLTIQGDEKGVWYDHKIGRGGSLYELADALNIERPKPQAGDEIPWEANLGAVPDDDSATATYDGLAAYAEAHGLTAGQMAKARWESVEKDGRPALRFPVKSLDGETTHWRWRFLDGDKPKYKGAGDANKAWYGLERAASNARAQGVPLVLVNGEISTVAATFHGIAACATTTGEKANGLAPELLARFQEVYPDGPVWIAIEGDMAGRKYAKAVAKQIGHRAEIVDLMLDGSQDIADFVVRYGAQAWEKLQKCPRERGAVKSDENGLVEISEVVKLARLQRVDASARRPALPTGFAGMDTQTGGGLRGGDVTVILGDTGMGKSTLAASLISNLLPTRGYVETTELTPLQYVYKLAAALTGKPAIQLMAHRDYARQTYGFTEADERTIESALSFIGQSLVVSPEIRSDANDLRQRLVVAKEKHDIQWAVVDSLNKLRMTGAGYFAHMTEASTAIELMAKELEIPIIVTAQVGRKVEPTNPRPPMLHDGKGSGGIEEDAAYVWGLYNYNYYVDLGTVEPDPAHPDGIAWLYPLKSRWGGRPGKPLALKNVNGALMREVAHETLSTKTL